MRIKHKVYLVIITSKDLLTHVLVSLPLETILMFMLKKCCKEKTLWEYQKKQNHTQFSPTFKNSFMLKSKRLAKTKLYK